MKRFLISFMTAGALLVGGWVVNAAATNFSGTWVLDKGRSQSLPRQLENVESYTMVVTQDNQQLTVEHKIVGGGRPGGERRDSSGQGGEQGSGRDRSGQGSGRGYGRGRGGFGGGMQSATYRLDGSETKMEASDGRGGATLKARWNSGGKVLELTNTRSFNYQGNEMTRTTTERWELSDGGKVLKVTRTTDGRQGTQESTLVFNRQ